MFRIAFLIFLMSMLIAGAANAGISLPALLLLGCLVLLAVLIILARSEQEG